MTPSAGISTPSTFPCTKPPESRRGREAARSPPPARINCRSVSQVRDEATACHESQLGGAIGRKGPMAFLRRYFGLTETFMRAYPPPKRGLREQDLFAGGDGV